jgi:hypothetical protein
MPPGDPTWYSSRPPPPSTPPSGVPPRPPTATSLSALAHSQSPSQGPPSLVPGGGGAHRPAWLPYIAVGVTAAMGVVGGSYVYRSETAPKPIFLHGSPGVRHTADGKTVRWRTRATTVYIDSSVERLGPKARETIRKAFGTWLSSDAPLPAVSFASIDRAEARLKADGKSTILLAPIQIQGHENDLAITITFSDEKTGNVVEADIVINSEYPYAFLDRPVGVSGDGTPHDPKGSNDANGNVEPNGSSEANGAVGAPRDSNGATAAVQDPTGANLANGAARDANGQGNDYPDDGERDGGAGAPRVTTAANARTDENSSCVIVEAGPSCGRDVYDVENVLSHEVGHFFGLGEEMADTAATMYLCTNRCETHKRELTIVDQAAVAWLYAKEPSERDAESEVGCGGAHLASARTPHARVSLMVLGIALLAARWSRRTGKGSWTARARAPDRPVMGP